MNNDYWLFHYFSIIILQMFCNKLIATAKNMNHFNLHPFSSSIYSVSFRGNAF